MTVCRSTSRPDAAYILSTGQPDLLPSVHALHAYDVDVRAGRAGQCASERISGLHRCLRNRPLIVEKMGQRELQIH
jgi:hypothetical protein